MPQTPRVRSGLVTRGAMLMVGCALGAAAASWMLYAALPGIAGDRVWMVVPFAPLTALGVLVAGRRWTLRARPSVAEGIGALVVVEVIAWAFVAGLSREPFNEATFDIWALANVLFAPWWLVALGIGFAMDQWRLR